MNLLAFHPKQAIALTIATHDTLSRNTTHTNHQPPNQPNHSLQFNTIHPHFNTIHHTKHSLHFNPGSPQAGFLLRTQSSANHGSSLVPPFFEYILFLYSCLPAIFVSPPEQEYRNEVYSIMFQVTDVVSALILKKKG